MEHPPKRQRISRTAARWRSRNGETGRTSADKPQFVHQASDVVPTSYEAPGKNCSEPIGRPSSTGHSRKVSEGKGTIFHRRQATESNEAGLSLGLTVTVQVGVNEAGSTSAVATLPTVPTVPTVVPYPSDLTVPAVPTQSSVAPPTVPTVPSYPFTTTVSQVVPASATTNSEPTASSETTPGEGMIGLTATANGGSSQVVMSPPPTPYPPTPSASAFPSASNSSGIVSVAGISTASSSTFPPNENVTTSGKLLPSSVLDNYSLSTLAFTTYSDGSVGYTTIDLGPMSSTEASSSITTIPAGLGPSAISSLVSAASVTSSGASIDSTLTSPTPTSMASTSVEFTSSAATSSTSSTSQSLSESSAFGTGGAGPSGSAGTPSSGSGSAPTGAVTPHATNTTPTPVVVGGVVGGVAGLAVLLLLALLLLRWYKRRGQARQPLDGGDGETAAAVAPMAQRSARFPPVGAAAGLLHRFSAPRTPPEPPPRSFERVSGRKIPSMFSGARPDSEPMNPFADPTPGSIPPDASFYRDSEGFFGMGTDAAGAAAAAGAAGSGSSAASELPADESAAARASDAAAAEQEKFMPGPARVPVIHPGGPYSPMVVGPTPGEHQAIDSPDRATTPVSPSAGPGTLGRSHPSFDGSRGSRFTENVE